MRAIPDWPRPCASSTPTVRSIPAVAAVDGVIAGRRAAVEAGVGDRRHDVGRHAVEGERGELAVGGDRCLQVADTDVGGGDDGLQSGQHRREVHARGTAAVAGEVAFGLAPQRAVPQGIAGERQGQRPVAGRWCRGDRRRDGRRRGSRRRGDGRRGRRAGRRGRAARRRRSRSTRIDEVAAATVTGPAGGLASVAVAHPARHRTAPASGGSRECTAAKSVARTVAGGGCSTDGCRRPVAWCARTITCIRRSPGACRRPRRCRRTSARSSSRSGGGSTPPSTSTCCGPRARLGAVEALLVRYDRDRRPSREPQRHRGQPRRDRRGVCRGRRARRCARTA